MATLNITLPDPMKEFVEERVVEEGYNTTSDYFLDLVGEDQKRRAQDKLETMLLEGLVSEKKEMTAEDWTELKQRVLERHKVRQAA